MNMHAISEVTKKNNALETVIERQKAQRFFTGAKWSYFLHAFNIANHVGMRKHYALGVTGGARSINNGS